jgi:starch synthase
MVSAEMTPVIKVGGLADVVGSLPQALAQRGHEVHVVVPYYADIAGIATEPSRWLPLDTLPLRVGQRMASVTLRSWSDAPDGVTVDLVDAPGWFDRPGVYLHPDGAPFSDDIERWSILAQTALMVPELAGWPVDILHAHDAQGGMASIIRKHVYGDRPLPGPGRTLLTIHNLAHQNHLPASDLPRVGLPHELAMFPGPLEFYGQANLLKGAILASDAVNTVSPTYARQVIADPDQGFGLEGVLASLGDRFTGILNGIDTTVWDPAADPHLPAGFDAGDLDGKRVCRESLCEEVGLESTEGPLLGLVGRLVPQKGLDLVTAVLDDAIAAGFSLVVLGTGNDDQEAAVADAAARHPGRVAFRDEFNEGLAHRIYAGSDLFLMPSRFEPCGLAQLYSFRYGTLPVVRATGGLADTVQDAGGHEGNGFVFHAAEPGALWAALVRARAAYDDPAVWRDLQQRAMAADFGWDRAAGDYESRYEDLLGAPVTQGG